MCSDVFQHFNKVLGQRTVAYLNVDILLEGLDLLRVKATPALHTLTLEAAQKVTLVDSFSFGTMF